MVHGHVQWQTSEVDSLHRVAYELATLNIRLGVHKCDVAQM